MKKKQSPMQRFLALSDAQKDAEVAEFENSTDRSSFKPLTPAQRKRWDRINRKVGRPTIGAGAKQISVSMEIDRLNRVDRYARAHALKRTQVIARGVDLLLSRAG